MPTYTRIEKDSVSFNSVFSLNYEAKEGKTLKSTTERLFNAEFYLTSILHNKIQEVCVCNKAKNNDSFLALGRDFVFPISLILSKLFFFPLSRGECEKDVMATLKVI